MRFLGAYQEGEFSVDNLKDVNSMLSLKFIFSVLLVLF